MKKSKRLIPVEKIKKAEEREQARQLGAAQKEFEQAIQKRDELESYRYDYYKQMNLASNSVCSSELARYQLFLSQLNKAVERQIETVKLKQQVVDMQRKKWIDAKARLTAMTNLIEQARLEEVNVADKQEQKIMDEQSQHSKSVR